MELGYYPDRKASDRTSCFFVAWLASQAVGVPGGSEITLTLTLNNLPFL